MGSDLINAINATKWLAFGIGDRLYSKYSEYDNKIFCMASTEKGMQYWLDNCEHYLFKDGEGNKLMVILELPINNRGAFLEGRYSELYPKDIVSKIIPEFRYINGIKYDNPNFGIITKKEEQREEFQNKINEDFNLNPPIVITPEQEYEYPPLLNREIFNYEAN